ncbi:MAG: hypothetical protein JSU06_05460 [Actinobacteria bacterium]|nr:hypothetical protein [Actinomycetota bacterium]
MQRLSDQRRTLALAGLAAGAVFSAAIFRRRWHKGELQAEPAMVRPEPQRLVDEPEVGQPSARPEQPAAAEVSSPTNQPEAADQPEAINAPPPGEVAAPGGASAAVASAEVASSANLEPVTGELSAEEASILAVLAQSGRTDEDRTAIAVATSLERDTGEVAAVLRKLGTEGVVSAEVQASSGEEFWAVTERGVRRLGAQS